MEVSEALEEYRNGVALHPEGVDRNCLREGSEAHEGLRRPPPGGRG